MEVPVAVAGWANQTEIFMSLINTYRSKELFCDCILACERRLFRAHKMILSMCSEFFERIFLSAQEKNPVIILHEIEAWQVECLLNYMYKGETSVSDSHFLSLCRAANCLQIKGFDKLELYRKAVKLSKQKDARFPAEKNLTHSSKDDFRNSPSADNNQGNCRLPCDKEKQYDVPAFKSEGKCQYTIKQQYLRSASTDSIKEHSLKGSSSPVGQTPSPKLSLANEFVKTLDYNNEYYSSESRASNYRGAFSAPSTSKSSIQKYSERKWWKESIGKDKDEAPLERNKQANTSSLELLTTNRPNSANISENIYNHTTKNVKKNMLNPLREPPPLLKIIHTSRQIDPRESVNNDSPEKLFMYRNFEKTEKQDEEKEEEEEEENKYASSLHEPKQNYSHHSYHDSEISQDKLPSTKLTAIVSKEENANDPLLKKIQTNKRKRVRGPKSWEYLLRLLRNPASNPSLIKWEDEEAGVFRLTRPETIAERWGRRTGKHINEILSYESFSRVLRYHYATGTLCPVYEKSFVYQFGPKAQKALRGSFDSENVPVAKKSYSNSSYLLQN